jgi:hypothetical protein
MIINHDHDIMRRPAFGWQMGMVNYILLCEFLATFSSGMILSLNNVAGNDVLCYPSSHLPLVSQA